MKPKIFKHHHPVLFLYLVLPFVPGIFSEELMLELKPDNPFVYIGDNLELNCTASDAVADSLVLFRGADELIDSKFYQKLDNSTIHLSLPITESDKNINSYLCCINYCSAYSPQYLKMEYKPRPVENVSCQIYNWETLTCTWDLGPYIHGLKNISVFVVWTRPFVSGNCTVAEDKSHFSMDFMFYSYNFTITVSHSRSKEQHVSVSKSYDKQKIIVKPAAVSDLIVESEENLCVTLNFNHSLYHSSLKKVERKLIIRATYKSKWELQPLVVQKYLDDDNITVCNVRPYSNYKFDVDVFPVENDGVWSNLTSIEYKTKPTVPGSGPTSTNGSYDQGYCQNGKKMVTIYIQHVPESLTHGIMKNYIAVYTPVPQGEQLTATELSTVFTIEYNLKCYTDYFVELKATNNVGTSTNNTYVYIPKLSQEPIPSDHDPSLLITVYKESNNSDKRVIAKWSGLKPQPLYYKLFWCQSLTIRCQEDIRWVEVKGDVTSKILHSDMLNIDYVEARKYIFSMSAIYEGNNFTPMTFAKCIYQSWAVPKDPPHLQLDEKNAVRSLRVSWKYNTCQSLVYIQSYNIYHCPTNKNGNCTGKYETERVDGAVNNYQLTNLKAETNYSVWMQTVSPGGLGPASEKLYGVPSEDNFLAASAIIGIIFGILVGMSCIFCIISRICCRKYWKNCCKKYDIKDITVKEENLKTSYAYIYDNETDVQINGDEQINKTVTPKLQTQLSDDSGTFSLPRSPSVKTQLPSISEEVSNNPKTTARSVSEICTDKPSGESNRDQIENSTTSTDEPLSYYKMGAENGQLLLSEDSTKMIAVNKVNEHQKFMSSERNSKQVDIALSNLPILGNSTTSYVPIKKILLDKPYVSNVPTGPQSTTQSFVRKDSESSSSASSNSPTSQSTSTDSDSVPSYIKIDLNADQYQPRNGSDNNTKLISQGANEGTLQSSQEMPKLDNECSASNKPLSDYVDPTTLNNLQPLQIPKQNQSLGESHI